MSATTTAHGPIITVPYDECTLQLCPIEAAQITYDPNLAGNVLYLSIFSAALVVNIVLGLWYRTWGYLIGMLLGCVLEVLGYVGRVQMHFNPFPQDPFFLYVLNGMSLLTDRPLRSGRKGQRGKDADGYRSVNRYLIPVTIASIFFTASIYLCLARIVVVFGEHLSFFRPRTYTILFILWFVICPSWLALPQSSSREADHLTAE
jgi:hypothetical protein